MYAVTIQSTIHFPGLDLSNVPEFLTYVSIYLGFLTILPSGMMTEFNERKVHIILVVAHLFFSGHQGCTQLWHEPSCLLCFMCSYWICNFRFLHLFHWKVSVNFFPLYLSRIIIFLTKKKHIISWDLIMATSLFELNFVFLLLFFFFTIIIFFYFNVVFKIIKRNFISSLYIY